MNIAENPFWVWTPEEIDAEQALRLFVDIFTDFPAIESPAHTFVHGPRGSGKSMMFRMMRPDCAQRRHACSFSALPYLGVYVPIKRTEITQTELAYLDRHPARYVFSEHLLCVYFAGKIFEDLASKRVEYSQAPFSEPEFADWAKRCFFDRLNRSQPQTLSERPQAEGNDPIKARFLSMRATLQEHWRDVEDLIRSMPLNPERLTEYRGPLFAYHNFLLPLLESLSELPFLPKAPVYLLVDDADNLSRTQTEIFNSWIATRTTFSACIKASTQLRYKTRLTYGGQRIEAPHDYQDVDVSVLYTTRRDHYLNRLSLIVEKRLALSGLPDDPKAFFPEDEAQINSVKAIARELRERAEAGHGRGHRPRDDANRYARPEFIRRLGGKRKSTHSYSYSGFEQLAHISSGVIRWFLEPAAQMFSEQKARATQGEPVVVIQPDVQNDQIRKFSEQFHGVELENIKKDAISKDRDPNDDSTPECATDYQHLESLIDAMGKTFFNILTDEKRGERRVFSIALSDRPDEHVQHVLDLGVEEGYFYRTTIGTKTGHGRTARYVLSRRLAPYFSLDPTSFSGYLFVTNENLKRAMTTPKALLRESVPDEDVQMALSIE